MLAVIEFAPWMLALLILYWVNHRGDGVAVSDGLALNWAVNQAAMMIWVSAGWGGAPLLFFWFVDLLSASWLGLYINTRLSRRVAKWFLPMLAVNAVIWALGTAPIWHYWTLLALAFAQALTVTAGLWGNGLLEAFDNTRHSLRDKLVDAAAFIARGGR